MLAAGHETVANTLTWMFLEMARNPTIQARLRREIKSVEQSVRLRGDSEFTHADCEAMTYLNAFIKVSMAIPFHKYYSDLSGTQESLRFHPVGPSVYRRAGKNDVLPLSTPIVTTSGEQLTALPIPKGIRIVTSIAAYNRYYIFKSCDNRTHSCSFVLREEIKNCLERILIRLTQTVGWIHASRNYPP